ncbi:sulfhydrogenase subunit delta [Halochromatium roseum]|uniref:NADH-quinone oxidoreductase subunit B family protein n=1 Tax=Halochromatium roseum TaxID=391920 RepID=UPI00191319CE|nr:sulfhydrogenase subunit delta [Halochromatium roseum]MBK5941522.1 sulfhydrogenase subunit delta [Halochromatium roseum]
MTSPPKSPLQPVDSLDRRPRLAVHKLSSCDGCQLALLNAGASLLRLAERFDIVHFAEAGIIDVDAEADIALVEGSVSTAEEAERIQTIRARSRWLMPIGACATAGGPQALKNLANAEAWIASSYPEPQHIDARPTADAVAAHVHVELELPGCPVSTPQVLAALASLLAGATPLAEQDKICLDCKRRGQVCVLVTQDAPCLGPITVTGCGALCPSLGRACYGCYGPAENPEVATLAQRFAELGLDAEAVKRRFLFQQSGAAPFQQLLREWHPKPRAGSATASVDQGSSMTSEDRDHSMISASGEDEDD